MASNFFLSLKCETLNLRWHKIDLLILIKIGECPRGSELNALLSVALRVGHDWSDLAAAAAASVARGPAASESPGSLLERQILSLLRIYCINVLLRFPGNSCVYGASCKEPACQGRRCKRFGFNPWVGNDPWRRAWQPTPVYLPGESRAQRSLAGYSPKSWTLLKWLSTAYILKNTDIFPSKIPVVLNLFGTRDLFCGRQFFHRLGMEGWFWDDSRTLHLLCTLFLLLLHRHRPRSSGIRSQRLGTPV